VYSDLVVMRCAVCKGPALYWKGRPYFGELIIPTNIRLLDGTTPIFGALYRCGTCGDNACLQYLTPDGGWAEPPRPEWFGPIL